MAPWDLFADRSFPLRLLMESNDQLAGKPLRPKYNVDDFLHIAAVVGCFDVIGPSDADADAEVESDEESG